MATRLAKSTLHSITRTGLDTTRSRASTGTLRQIQPKRGFTSTPLTKSPEKMSTSSLISLAQNRRTIYKLGKASPVQDADSKIEELVNEAILHVPSSFNTQSTRLVVLLHGEHDKLWDIAIEAFGGLVKSGKVSQEMWENQTLPKLRGFQAAYGTVCSCFISYILLSFSSVVIDWSNLYAVYYRSSSSKIQPISNPFKRNSLSSRIISRRGLIILMLCISISVCILSSPSLPDFLYSCKSCNANNIISLDRP